jgi:hypothetical protein
LAVLQVNTGLIWSSCCIINVQLCQVRVLRLIRELRTSFFFSVFDVDDTEATDRNINLG